VLYYVPEKRLYFRKPTSWLGGIHESDMTTTLTISGPFGVPIHIHWSVLFGAIIPCLYVGFSLVDIPFFIIGFVLLVGVHEFGHAIAAKLLGLKVFAVHINITGGHCRYELPPTIWKALFVTSAGLLAQILLLLITTIYIAIFGYESGRVVNDFILVFTFLNALMLIVNVLPFKPLAGLSTDGLILWKLMIAWIRLAYRMAARVRKDKEDSISGHC